MTAVAQTLIIVIIIITLEGLIVLLYIGKIFCCNDIHLLIKGKVWNDANFIIVCTFNWQLLMSCNTLNYFSAQPQLKLCVFGVFHRKTEINHRIGMLIPWYINFLPHIIFTWKKCYDQKASECNSLKFYACIIKLRYLLLSNVCNSIL